MLKTSNTFCDEANPIILETIVFPEPVISLRIEPKARGDQERMGMALHRLSDEDPTFKIKSRFRNGRKLVISGMGELHLDIIVDRMKRENLMLKPMLVLPRLLTKKLLPVQPRLKQNT